MEDVKHNAVGWFEIPVQDMERAITFYESVLGYALERHQMGPLDMAWFTWVEGGNGSAGSLVKHEWYVPAQEGTLIYFTAPSGDLSNELARVEDAGGAILTPRKEVGEYGFVAIIKDTEGNRVGLHSRQ